jgi:iron complex transport system substrate-binding protein
VPLDCAFRERKRRFKPHRCSHGAFSLTAVLVNGETVRTYARSMLRPIVAVAALFLFFCGATRGSQAAPPSVAYRQITDEIGRTIRIPQSIHRIVSLAPNLTETIFALGLQDRLVGDTDFCDFPREAQQKTRVGGAVNPSLEAIAALHPDLVLVTKNLNRLETVQALADIGIPSYATDPHTIDAIIASIAHLADVLGASETGSALTADLARQMAALHHRLESQPIRRVLFVVWTEPLISIGNSTFIADALRHAGAVSVIDSSQNWPQVNLEEIVHQQPEFLIFAASSFTSGPHIADALFDLPGWRLLNAVRNRRLVTISDAINRPAPRLISAVEDLARQLHPEAFLERPQYERDQPQSMPPLGAPLARLTNYAPQAEQICAL